jgi:hypothetical protein
MRHIKAPSRLSRCAQHPDRGSDGGAALAVIEAEEEAKREAVAARKRAAAMRAAAALPPVVYRPKRTPVPLGFGSGARRMGTPPMGFGSGAKRMDLPLSLVRAYERASERASELGGGLHGLTCKRQRTVLESRHYQTRWSVLLCCDVSGVGSFTVGPALRHRAQSLCCGRTFGSSGNHREEVLGASIVLDTN